MAVIETWIKTDLKSIVKVNMFHGILFSQDNMANLIGVELLDGGEPATVTGSVSANVLRADGTTVAVAGTLSGNKASVTLPQAAYAVPGMLAIVIKLTDSSTVTTIGAIQSIVYRASTDTIIDPGTIIPSVQDLIAAIEDAVESIPPDYSELTGEVSDLKTALTFKPGSVKTRTSIFEVPVTGESVPGYLKNNGTIGSASDAYVSDYQTAKGTYFLYNVPEDYAALSLSINVCFYASDKTFISYNHVGVRSGIVLAIPSNAVFLRFDCLNNFTPHIYFLCEDAITDTNKESDITVIGENKVYPVLLTNYKQSSLVGYLNQSGTITADSTARTCGYIPLFNESDLLLDFNYGGSGSFHICFYASDFTHIIRETLSVNDQICQVPTNAKYIRYDIGASWEGHVFIRQAASKPVPTKDALIAAGILDNITIPINVKYRGLLAGFGNSETKLRVFGTTNFNYFEQIGNTFAPSKGNAACRDPFIMVYKDWFYIFYTDVKGFTRENNDIGVCRTRDFLTYEELDPIICNQSFKLCWGPSIYEENGNYYMTVTASETNYQETYTYLYDIDIDTLAISNQRVVSVGTSTRQLDFHFYKINGSYYAVGKYDDSTTTVFAKSTTLNGPYTVLANQRYSQVPEEGQFVLRLDNGYYRLYVNDYSQGQKIYFCDIPDIDNPTANVGTLHEIASNSAVPLFHVSIIDFNRPYSFQNI